MSCLGDRQGCKVAWSFWTTEAEAKTAAEKAIVDAERRAAQGYDFGYQSPGEIRRVDDYEFGPSWKVTLP